MKKLISTFILGVSMLLAIFAFLWYLIIKPCIEIYNKYDFLGVVAWFIALFIIICVVFIIFKIFEWAIDNA